MKKVIQKVIALAIKLFILLIFISVAWVTLYKFVNPPITPLMLIRYFDDSGNATINKKWANYDDISGYMKVAVIAAEDQTFATNNGFDLRSIGDAIEDRLEGDRLRGASTITQQTAKNVFLWPGRSWIRKALEAYYTILIENIWGKQRILEVYLNVIETGDGIYGVGEAARVYFGKSAKDLDLVESALIAATLPNPILMSPQKPSEYVLTREMWIREHVGYLGGTSYLKKLK